MSNPLDYKWPMREGYALRRRKRCKVSLSHRGAANADVKAYVLGQATRRVDTGHGEEEQRILTLEIGTGQTNFATATTDAEPISVGDKVTYLARPYFVAEVVTKDAAGRVYEVMCVEEKALSDGA